MGTLSPPVEIWSDIQEAFEWVKMTCLCLLNSIPLERERDGLFICPVVSKAAVDVASGAVTRKNSVVGGDLDKAGQLYLSSCKGVVYIRSCTPVLIAGIIFKMPTASSFHVSEAKDFKWLSVVKRKVI